MATKAVAGVMVVELEVPFFTHIDVEEYEEWLNGDPSTSDTMREFIMSGRDWRKSLNRAKAHESFHACVGDDIDRITRQ